MTRRICPGRFLADRIAFTFAAALLKAYGILPLDGESVPKEYVYQDAITRQVPSLKKRTGHHFYFGCIHAVYLIFIANLLSPTGVQKALGAGSNHER
jgi:hypothetical protein